TLPRLAATERSPTIQLRRLPRDRRARVLLVGILDDLFRRRSRRRIVSRDLELWACQRGAARITGSERSGTSSGRPTSYPNINSLHLGLAIGKLRLQRQNIDAHKIRTRAIKRNKRGYLERQALLVIGSCHLCLLDGDLAIFGRRRQLDRRKRAGRTVRPHVDIHPHTNIRVRFPTRHAADALLLS